MYQYFCLVLLLRSFSDDKNLETLGRTACLLCPRELPSRNLLVTITQDKKKTNPAIIIYWIDCSGGGGVKLESLQREYCAPRLTDVRFSGTAWMGLCAQITLLIAKYTPPPSIHKYRDFLPG